MTDLNDRSYIHEGTSRNLDNGLSKRSEFLTSNTNRSKYMKSSVIFYNFKRSSQPSQLEVEVSVDLDELQNDQNEETEEQSPINKEKELEKWLKSLTKDKTEVNIILDQTQMLLFHLGIITLPLPITSDIDCFKIVYLLFSFFGIVGEILLQLMHQKYSKVKLDQR